MSSTSGSTSRRRIPDDAGACPHDRSHRQGAAPDGSHEFHGADEAAGRIHTDFERGFIRAEVIHYDDYIRHQGEHGAKDTGRLHVEGKDYVIKEGDVVHFRFNV